MPEVNELTSSIFSMRFTFPKTCSESAVSTKLYPGDQIENAVLTNR